MKLIEKHTKLTNSDNDNSTCIHKITGVSMYICSDHTVCSISCD